MRLHVRSYSLSSQKPLILWISRRQAKIIARLFFRPWSRTESSRRKRDNIFSHTHHAEGERKRTYIKILVPAKWSWFLVVPRAAKKKPPAEICRIPRWLLF